MFSRFLSRSSRLTIRPGIPLHQFSGTRSLSPPHQPLPIDPEVDQYLPLLHHFVHTLQNNPHPFKPDPIAHSYNTEPTPTTGTCTGTGTASKPSQLFRPLTGVDAVLIQHQMGQHIAMVRALFALGLSPANTTTVDIPYTANRRVVDALTLSYGIPRHQLHTHDYRLSMDYHTYQTERTQSLVLQSASKLTASLSSPALAAATARREQPIVVLDDGAYWLEAIAELMHQTITSGGTGSESKQRELFRLLDQCCIVEQTQRGLIKMRTNPLIQRLVSERSPVVVNVAECRVKKTIEPAQIGDNAVRNVIASLHKHLTHRQSAAEADVKPVAILICGYGAIGEATARRLRTEYPRAVIYVNDSDSNKRSAAQKAGFTIWHDAIATANGRVEIDAAVGCSGVRSFTAADAMRYGRPNTGLLLVSVSSANHELSFDQFVSLASGSGPQTTAVNTGTGKDSDPFSVEFASDRNRARVYDEPFRHQHITFTLRQPPTTTKSIRTRTVPVVILNGGFPITFVGELNAVPPHAIQSTLCLMVGGAVDAVNRWRTIDRTSSSRAGSGGVQLLDPWKDHWIESHFARYQPQQSQSARL